MMLLAAIIAIGSAIAGLYASYYLGVASRAAIVFACTICFAVTWIIRSIRDSSTPRL